MAHRAWRDNIPLLAAVGLSLIAHAAGAVGLGGLIARDGGERPSQPAAQRLNSPDLGLRRSEAVTVTWLGFEEPTPHRAPRAPVEQPRETQAAASNPSPSEAETPAPSARQPTRTSQPRANQQRQIRDDGREAAAAAERDVAAARGDAAAEQVDGLPGGVIRAFEDARDDGPPRGTGEGSATGPGDETGSASDGAPSDGSASKSDKGGSDTGSSEGSGADGRESDERPSEAASSDDAADADGADSGENPAQAERAERESSGKPDPAREPSEADRESTPASREEPVEYRPGKPVAAEGLEITTRVPPRHSIVTRLTAVPRQPVFELSFSRDGTVSRVRIVRSSGDSDVDQPWVNALYKWTASGKALERLPEDDPDAVVTRTFQLVPLQ